MPAVARLSLCAHQENKPFDNFLQESQISRTAANLSSASRFALIGLSSKRRQRSKKNPFTHCCCVSRSTKLSVKNFRWSMMVFVLHSLQQKNTNQTPYFFAADDPRWIRQPSSDYPSTRDSVQKQVMLNAYEF